jgi:beta-phosphoglucomutase family hydrolase
MNPWYAIFDWDGVIIDSSALHEESWNVLAAREGLPLPPGHFKRGFGMKNEVIIPTVLGWSQEAAEIDRLAREKERTYRELVKEHGIDPVPGVVGWLRTLKGAKVPTAIGSSTHRKNIDCVLDRIRLGEYFDVIVSGDQVTQGKPAPDIFLSAAEQLQAPPNRCVVFEDAHVGIEAALAAGMKVVGVATTHPADSLEGAHRVVQRLDELTLEGMQALAGMG